VHLILVRHGQADYGDVDERHFIGHGRDLAKLNMGGIRQAEAVSNDSRLIGAEIIVSSPYTRALQTAAIISRNTGIPIIVETDLHEWLPDTTFQYDGPTHFHEIDEEIRMHRGKCCDACRYRWESFGDIGRRAFVAMRKYLRYNKVIAVCHGMVMRQFVYEDEIPNCGILEMEFSADSVWNGYVDP
jgi:broad specificity phosphatase PhoE